MNDYRTYNYIFFILFVFILSVVASSYNNSGSDSIYIAERMLKCRPDSALILLEAIDFPEDMPPKKYAKYCQLLVIAHQKNKISIKEDSLIHYAVDYYKRDSENKEYIHSLLLLGNVYEEQDSLFLAEKYYQEVYSLAEKNNFPELQGISSFELGGLYKYRAKYEEGIHWLNKARIIFEDNNDRKMKHRSMRHLADCHVLLGRTDTALVIYNKILDNIPPEKVNVKADVYKNIAITYKKASLYKESLQFIRKSIETSSTESLYPLQFTILSSIYEDMGILDSCLYYDELAMQYAKKQENLSMLYKAYEAMSDDNYPERFDNYALSRTLSDSILMKQRYETMKYQRLYNVEKFKKKNKELLVKTQRYLFFAILIILISLIFFLFQRNKKKYQRKQYEREIEDKNNIIRAIRSSLSQRYLIYKRMIQLSISPNKDKHKVFLKEYNKILFNKENEFVFDWNIIYDFGNHIFENYIEKLDNSYPHLMIRNEKFLSFKKWDSAWLK